MFPTGGRGRRRGRKSGRHGHNLQTLFLIIACRSHVTRKLSARSSFPGDVFLIGSAASTFEGNAMEIIDEIARPAIRDIDGDPFSVWAGAYARTNSSTDV